MGKRLPYDEWPIFRDWMAGVYAAAESGSIARHIKERLARDQASTTDDESAGQAQSETS